MAKSISVYVIINFTLVLFQGFEVSLTVGALWNAGSIPASGNDTPVKLRYSTVPVQYRFGSVPYGYICVQVPYHLPYEVRSIRVST